MERKYEGPLAPNENGVIIWPDNLAELDEMSEGTMFPALAKMMARTEDERTRDKVRSRDYDKRARRLEKMRSKLTGKYPDQWVALGDNWEMVVAKSRDELRGKLIERGARPAHSAKAFMNTKPHRWIL